MSSSTSKTSIFGFSTFLAAAVALLLLGLVYLMLAGTSQSSSVDPVEDPSVAKFAQLQSGYEQAFTDLQTKLDAVSADENQLRQQVADLATKLEMQTNSNSKRIEDQTQNLSVKIDEVTTSSNNKIAELTTAFEGLKAEQANRVAPAVVAERVLEQVPTFELPSDVVRRADLSASVEGVEAKVQALAENTETQIRQVEAKLSAETAARVASFDLQAANLAEVGDKNAGEIANISGVVVGLTAAASSIQDKLVALGDGQENLKSAQSALETKTVAIQKNASLSANRLLAASRLRTAMKSYGPFEDELAYLSQFSQGDDALTEISNSVSDVASKGVQSPAELQQEYRIISSRLIAEELGALAKQGSKSDQLKAGLVNLLGVTREDGSAVVTSAQSALEAPLSEIEKALEADDFVGASSKINALDPEVAMRFKALTFDLDKVIAVENATADLDSWISNLGS